MATSDFCHIRQTDGSEVQVEGRAINVASMIANRPGQMIQFKYGPLALLTGQPVFVNPSHVLRVF